MGDRLRAGKVLEWFGYPTVKKFEDMITHFDRHTDRRTLHDGIKRSYIASRGKKEYLCLYSLIS